MKIKINSNSESAITLIALVITIIVLIILAGVTLSLVIGDSGMISRTKDAVIVYNYDSIYEELYLKILEAQTTNIKAEPALKIIVEFLINDTENDYTISTFSQLDNPDDVGNIKNSSDLIGDETEIYIIYKNCEFKLDSNMKLYKTNYYAQENTGDENNEKILSYRIKDNNESNLSINETILYDLSENNNEAILYNTTFSEDNDGISFDGSSSYSNFHINQELTFPLTYEFDIKMPTETTRAIIFTEPESKTAFGIWDDFFSCTLSTDSQTVPIPDDFFDGTLKHIVLEFNSLTDFELYINGTKLSQNTSTDGWYSYDLTPCIGKRGSGCYFNGTLYTFKIYNRLLEEAELLSTQNRTDLVLEYIIKNNPKYMCTELNDLTQNNNYANCNNVIYNNEKKGIVFNGESSYADLDIQQELTFPLTYEFAIKTSAQNKNSVIFVEPNTQTAFGMWDDYFMCTLIKYTQTVSIPDDFYDGTLKYIVLKYNTLTDFELYINGQKLSRNNSNDAWQGSIDSARIGCRDNRNYFNGILYEFNIYKGALTENQITKNYKKAKLDYNK